MGMSHMNEAPAQRESVGGGPMGACFMPSFLRGGGSAHRPPPSFGGQVHDMEIPAHRITVP